MKRVARTVLIPIAAASLAVGALAACGGGGGATGEAGAPAGFESQTREDDPNAAMAIGDNVPLPADWPTAVPVPNGGILNSVGVAENGNATALWVFTTPVESVGVDYDAALTQAGFTKVPDSDIAVEGMVGADWTGNGFTLSVLTSDNGDGTTSLNLSATLAE